MAKHQEPDTTAVLKAGLKAQERRAQQAGVSQKTIDMLKTSTGNK